MIFVEWLNHERTVIKAGEVTEPQDISIHLPGRVRRVHNLQVLPGSGLIWTFTPGRTQRGAFEYFTPESADVSFNDMADGSLNVQLEDKKTVECMVIIPRPRRRDWEPERTAGIRVTWHPDGSQFAEEERKQIAAAKYSKAANTLVATQTALF